MHSFDSEVPHTSLGLAPDTSAGGTTGTGSETPEPASAAEEVIGAVVAMSVAAAALTDAGDTTPRASLSEEETTDLAIFPEESSTGVPLDLQRATNRDLRRWSIRLFKVIDLDFPPYGAVADYERISDELKRRRDAATGGRKSVNFREKFCDNARGHRFELFRDGVLTGYVAYTMRAGIIRLHRTVVLDAFDREQVEGTLMRNVVLAAHKRRLAAVPYCPIAQGFFRQNPQYRQLTHQ